MAGVGRLVVGKQPDGTFLVSTGQRILPGTITFDQRLSEIALHPRDDLYAVVAKSKVFLASGSTLVEGSVVDLKANAGFHGAAWSPNGREFVCTTDSGHVQFFSFVGKKLVLADKVSLAREPKKNPVPGGLCFDEEGKRLFVACADDQSVAVLDVATKKVTGRLPVDALPFTVKITPNQQALVVTNWGGERPEAGDRTDESGTLAIQVTPEGSAATGTVSIINLASGRTREVQVGIHPTGLAVTDETAYVCNSIDDSVSVVDLRTAKVKRSIQMRFRGKKVIGAMPNECFLRGETLFTLNGGDNALCEIDTSSGKVKGYRPAGFFPIAAQLSSDGGTAYVVNSKGNGSVRNSSLGLKKRNTHDFQGTVSVIDLKRDLRAETDQVANFNQWNVPQRKPGLKVYNGAVKHVIYVIKENRTYDEVFGDLPRGDGDPDFASIGGKVMPNHHKLANEFGLFDNAYTCGTNSADGHQWCDQAMANEYLEHFYVGYSRTYPDDGEDAMALNSSGRIWDSALKAGKKVRVYGEWAGDEQAAFLPRKPKDWFEAWEDRQKGSNLFQFKAHTRVGSLKPILCPDYHYWPLIQSDQSRLDVFEREFREFEKNGNLPNLIVMSLPSDHSEGTDPAYPTPRSMMADNDLALGRLVDIVSHSKYWMKTCIFVTQDDSQGGPDHVDGHRTVNLVVSPYCKRKSVNSEFSTQLSMLKSIELMLGLKPMTRFDTIAAPLTECFVDEPDYTPYEVAPNIVPLGERNPSGKAMTEQDAYWLARTKELDWSGVDRADWYWLNRIVWHSIHKGRKPYPGTPYDRPGNIDVD